MTTNQTANNSFGVTSALWANLRNCQKASITRALQYLRNPLTTLEHKSCLLSLPTGAGKSGVIAVLAHYASQNRILVLCHRRAVCAQLTKELDGGFFQRAASSAVIQKPVFRGISDITPTGIYVTTFQMLNRLDEASLEQIRNSFDLILIDEGHSEPSPVWRTLVRGSSAHKIVVTATPYRNDLFQFDINPQCSYVYTFAEALEDDVLAEPNFGTVSEADLVQAVRDFLDQNPGAKCIVKCKNFATVEQYYNIFSALAPTIAIHEQYTNDKRDHVRTSVPKDLSGSNYRILVHQHKLDEGVDIPSAKLLILTYVLGSGRELVQTIGRVVRTFNGLVPLVLELNHAANKSMWESYRAFDRSLRSPQGVDKFLASLNTARLIELYLNAFPDFSYHDNRFVEKFDLNSFAPDSSLVIPTASVCFIETKVGFSLEHAVDILYWRSSNQGELCRIIDSDSTPIKIVLCIAFKKSRFLSNELFFEPSLEIILLRQLPQNVVAVFDSRGRTYDGDEELKLGVPLPQDKLLKVMAQGAVMRPKEASTRAIGSARRRPESMHIKGANLDELGGQQQFAAYRMSTFKCDTLDNLGNKSGTYYIGVDSGRISDHLDKQFSLSDLDEWFQMIERCISSNVEPNSRVLNSFAKSIAPTERLEAESLVLDFTSFENPVECHVNGMHFTIENDFIYRNINGTFLLVETLEETRVQIGIQTDPPHIIFTPLEEIFVDDANGTVPIDDLLLKSLHKVLFGDGITYSGGKFYELHLPTEVGFTISNSELAGVLIGMPELQHPDLTEKGTTNGTVETAGDEFSPNSVFHIIDKVKNYCLPNPTLSELGPFFSHISKPDIVLCADMGTEPADFIISSPEKLIYVHVKCGSSAHRPESSAGALAEVGSQAIKNMEMLVSRDKNLKAANWANLLSEWPQPNAPQRLQNRIRVLDGTRFDITQETIEDALSRLWDVVAQRRRSTAVRKEIWVVAANSFSVSDFENQMRLGSQGRSESRQAYQLIQGWMAAAANLDVEIRFFVSQ